jgi:hypothetical protein
MLNLNISLWYNEQNLETASFTKFFQDDLQKCLNRFGLRGNYHVNNPEVDNHIIILSNSDDSSAELLSQTEGLIQRSGTFIITINPLIGKGLSAFKALYSIPFWDKLYTTGEIRFFRRDSNETRLNYWEKITDISVELSGRGETTSKNKRGCVYLSQDDISHSTDRENLLRDLNDLGFDVVPEKPLSPDFKECTEQINSALQKVQLIIHLIPPIYTHFFINQHLSIAEHQCNISADFIKSNPNIFRVIWIPSSYEISDEENQVFVEKIQRDQEQTQGSAVMKSSIEDLKKYYRHILLNVQLTEPKSSEIADVYIITDSNTNGLLNSIQGSLVKSNLKVDTNFSGITYNQHLSKLAAAKVVVLCYTIQNEQWLSVKVNDILKSRGIDSFRPFEKIILLKGSSEINTEHHQAIFTQVVHGSNELSSIQFTDNKT